MDMKPTAMKKPLLPPPDRDTTPNPSDVIAQRLCAALLYITGGLAVFMAASGLVNRDESRLKFAAFWAAVCVLLLATRRWWKRKPSPLPAAADPVRVAQADAPRAASIRADAPNAPHAPSAVPRILVLNAALAGAQGNTAVLVERARALLAARAEVLVVHLAGGPASENLVPALRNAQAVLVATGTHWDSWSSVLQKYLEDATPTEGTPLWLGKPAAVLVTEHSVGGKEVLSRLQGVLSTFGCLIPPMSGLVISKAARLAAKQDAPAAADFWCDDDLAVVCHNLLAAASGTRDWRAWPVDRTGYAARWLA